MGKAIVSPPYRRGEPSSAGHRLCERGVLARGKGCAVGAEENTPVCGRSQKGRHQPSPKTPEALGSPDRLGRYDSARTCIQGRGARARGGKDEVAHPAARITPAQNVSQSSRRFLDEIRESCARSLSHSVTRCVAQRQ